MILTVFLYLHVLGMSGIIESVDKCEMKLLSVITQLSGDRRVHICSGDRVGHRTGTLS